MPIYVAPARERGLKCPMPVYGVPGLMVAPARERGLKSDFIIINDYYPGRSREGAWIEIHGYKTTFDSGYVAPARERGLKSTSSTRYGVMVIVAPARERGLKLLTELLLFLLTIVAPARERGLKSIPRT